MTQKNIFGQLADATIRGEWSPALAMAAFESDGVRIEMKAAFHGDMNAALSLLKNIYPGYQWGRDGETGTMWIKKNQNYDAIFTTQVKDPARSLLVAIVMQKDWELRLQEARAQRKADQEGMSPT